MRAPVRAPVCVRFQVNYSIIAVDILLLVVRRSCRPADPRIAFGFSRSKILAISRALINIGRRTLEFRLVTPNYARLRIIRAIRSSLRPRVLLLILLSPLSWYSRVAVHGTSQPSPKEISPRSHPSIHPVVGFPLSRNNGTQGFRSARRDPRLDRTIEGLASRRGRGRSTL